MYNNIKNKASTFINQVNFFSSNSCFVCSIFLIVLIIMIPTFSFSNEFNFWNKLIDIISYDLSFIFMFFIIGVNIFLLQRRKCSYFYLNRLGDFNIMKKKIFFDVIIVILYYFLIHFIISLSMSFLFSGSNFEVSLYKTYSITNVSYLIFSLFKFYFLIYFLSKVFFCISFLTNELLYFIILIVFSGLLIFLPFSNTNIVSGFESFYFINLIRPNLYNSFFTEFISFIFNIILLIIIYNILCYFSNKKKRDFL